MNIFHFIAWMIYYYGSLVFGLSLTVTFGNRGGLYAIGTLLLVTFMGLIGIPVVILLAM